SHCPLCMLPFLPCPSCAASPPSFDSVHAPFVYEGPMASAIQRFKYKKYPELAAPLAKLWLAHLTSALPALPLNVVPLPLHRLRYLQRGFDQTVLLSKALAQYTHKKLRLHWLSRAQATQQQMGHGQSARQSNVLHLEKAFVASPMVRNQAVLLVDDVVTTGSTAQACARVLKKAGAHSVHILCLSRTVFGE
ncbi:MAG: ComF family protein, partial [Cystobacterineae bacterium]|nr:ComF family protein [Cystobacterineae bacterium]